MVRVVVEGKCLDTDAYLRHMDASVGRRTLAEVTLYNLCIGLEGAPRSTPCKAARCLRV